MELFRVATEKWAEDLSGEGARLYGGRWNHKGTPALYCSQNRSLCTLEVLVHVKLNNIPKDLMLVTIYVPDDAEIRALGRYELPQGWDDYPYDSFTQDTGSSLLKTGESLGIRVPSSVVPQEHNVILNPRHKDFSRIMVTDIAPLGLSRFVSDAV
ncbi:MAG: RES family NAD+ phosphorylase [Balneolia bacterium]|nr:RES family NAD+ phosphorylase [Balneolia bacterium]